MSADDRQCVLSSRTRGTNVCDDQYHQLNYAERQCVTTRAAVDKLYPSPAHKHICLFHYNKYLHCWRGEGCIDKECRVSKLNKSCTEIQEGYTFEECSHRILSSLNNIHSDTYPYGSLIHRLCRETFNEHYSAREGHIPSKKRKRAYRDCDQVYIHIPM